MQELRLLIHHHHSFYKDMDGNYWMTSNIGRWVQALSKEFTEIGILTYESNEKFKELSTIVNEKNIVFFSLGKREEFPRNILLIKNIIKTCTSVGKKYDILLIRGMTPHQFRIWLFTSTKIKAFLLVGSLQFNKKFGSLISFVNFLLQSLRLIELKIIANNGTLLFANSPGLVKEINEILKKNANFVATNTIKIDEYSPFHIKKISYPWKILYCGRLDYKKGIEDLFVVIKNLNEMGFPSNLDIVGNGNILVTNNLKRKAGELQIEKMVCWHGLIEFGQKLFDFYKGSDVLIIPSHTEGFPKVIREAMAQCCPVIATNVGGIPAILTDQNNALLIPPKMPEMIARATIRLLTDEQLRENIITNAYDYAKTFSVEACANNLYENLVDLIKR